VLAGWKDERKNGEVIEWKEGWIEEGRIEVGSIKGNEDGRKEW
jgi:hypothetical protein